MPVDIPDDLARELFAHPSDHFFTLRQSPHVLLRNPSQGVCTQTSLWVAFKHGLANPLDLHVEPPPARPPLQSVELESTRRPPTRLTASPL